MARRHGWELPAHSLQIVAITVYFLLTIAYYAFFAPFVAIDAVYEYLAIGGYTFLAFCVLMLYTRCTAIDPADPGILIEPERADRSQCEGSLPGNASSLEEPCKTGPEMGEKSDAHHPTFCSKIGGIFCFCLVQEDCREDEEAVQQSSGEEEALFCTLCNAEVRKFSKHCRSCDNSDTESQENIPKHFLKGMRVAYKFYIIPQYTNRGLNSRNPKMDHNIPLLFAAT